MAPTTRLHSTSARESLLDLLAFGDENEERGRDETWCFGMYCSGQGEPSYLGRGREEEFAKPPPG